MSDVVNDEDNTREIHARISGEFFGVQEAESTNDPFVVKAEEIAKYRGFSPNFKRKNTRLLQKFQRGQDGAESKKVETEILMGYDIMDVVTPPYNLDYLAKIYEVSSPHFAACNAKASNIVGLGYEFLETRKTKEKMSEYGDDQKKLAAFRRRLESLKEELQDQLELMNEEDTFTETLTKAFLDREATGNGFLEIGRKVNGQIGFIGHIPATTMRVRKQRDGFVQIVGNRITFFRNFQDTETENPIGDDTRPNEVIHLKKYTPNNSYYGVPDIIPAKTALAGDEFAQRFNLDYFENKAVPRYIITVKGATLSRSSEAKLLEFFQTNLKGKNHRSLYIPLPADEDGNKVEFKMEAVESGVQDSSFNQYRRMNRDEILISHRVPISKLGLPEGVSLAAAKDADKTFKEQVARPEQKNLEKKINRIIAEFTDAFTLKFNELTLTDEDTQSKIDERYLRMKVIVPNEVRARLGMAGRSGGDEPVQLTGQQASEATAQATGNRRRDQERQGNQVDTPGNARNPQGEGRVTP
jgi:PBSX family phage portal protein